MADITLSSDIKRIATVNLSAISTSISSIETDSLLGPKGEKGDKGEQGEKGEKGDKGDTAYPEWGNITGDISNQIDLSEQLNSKADVDEMAQMILDRANTMIDLTQE